MEDLTFRILAGLAKNLGRAMSIQDLTKEIKRLYGTAYYANTYHAVQSMREQGLLDFGRLGKASSISLNLGSYLLIDFLAELELRRKRQMIEANPRFEGTLAEIDLALRAIPAQFALLMEAERNLRLNRIEILICLPSRLKDRAAEAMGTLGKRLTLRVDALPIEEARFLERLASAEHNPIQEFLTDSMALLNPQACWAAISRAHSRGWRARTADPILLSSLPLDDLMFNLGRFGFPLLGGASEGLRLCIEQTAAAALTSGEPRHRDGAAVILSKNPFDPWEMAFLAAKCGKQRELRALVEKGPRTRDKRELERLLPDTRVRRSHASGDKAREVYHAA